MVHLIEKTERIGKVCAICGETRSVKYTVDSVNGAIYYCNKPHCFDAMMAAEMVKYEKYIKKFGDI